MQHMRPQKLVRQRGGFAVIYTYLLINDFAHAVTTVVPVYYVMLPEGNEMRLLALGVPPLTPRPIQPRSLPFSVGRAVVSFAALRSLSSPARRRRFAPPSLCHEWKGGAHASLGSDAGGRCPLGFGLQTR